MFRFKVCFALNGVKREEGVVAASAGYARMKIESKYPGAVVVEILGVTPPPAVVRVWNPAEEKAAAAEKKKRRSGDK